MAKCVDCKYEGKYLTLPIPFPAQIVGFDEEMHKHGFKKKSDLTHKGMYCQAPGGGPTKDPIVLFQALTDQPCSFFSPKSIVKGKKKTFWKFWKTSK